MSLDDHVSAEDIARLAEGALPPETSEAILAHLSRCRSCMAAYVEAVRYRAAWLAEPDAFKPPKDVLEHARAAVDLTPAPQAVAPAPVAPAPVAQRSLARRWLVAGSSMAAAWLVFALVVRSVGTQSSAPLPSPVDSLLAENTHLARGLFLPGAERVRTRPVLALRGEGPEDGPTSRAATRVVDSLRTVYVSAKGARARGRTGYRYASALLVQGHSAEARDVVEELLAAEPGDCACHALAAQLDYARYPERAERHLREAVAAGCRDDMTRIDLAIVEMARGDSADARE